MQEKPGDKGAVDLSALGSILSPEDLRRPAIVGVGNRLRGDDGFGPFVVELLKGRVRAHLIDAGPSPENFTGVIKSICPSSILILDTIDFGGRPGELAVLNPDELIESPPSTHSLSLALLARYLKGETGAKVLIVGVQPGRLSLGEGMSDEVREAAFRLSRLISSLIRPA